MIGNPSSDDAASVVGHVASVSALVMYWLGLLTPLAAFIASCCVVAWHATLFYDRWKKKRDV